MNASVFSKNYIINALVFILIFITPLFTVFSRNISTPIFMIITVLLVIISLSQFGRHCFYISCLYATRSRGVWFAFTLVMFMAASAFWSPAPQRALESTGHLAGNFILLFFAFVCIQSINISLRFNPYALAISLIAAVFLIVEELLFQSPIRTLLGGSNEPFRLNRAAVAVVLFLPLCLVFLKKGRLQKALAIILVFLTMAMVLLSESESAKLAFFILLVLLPVFSNFHRNLVLLTALATVASLVFMPLFAIVLPDLLPSAAFGKVYYTSVGVRAEIWAAHATLVMNAPILGHGVEASFVAGDTYKHVDIPNHLLGKGHPHNFALQVWYELGAVGVLVFALLLSTLFVPISRLSKRYLPGVLSTFAAIWIVSMVSHGAWQAWWWSLVSIIVIIWLILVRSDIQSEASVE